MLRDAKVLLKFDIWYYRGVGLIASLLREEGSKSILFVIINCAFEKWKYAPHFFVIQIKGGKTWQRSICLVGQGFKKVQKHWNLGDANRAA